MNLLSLRVLKGLGISIFILTFLLSVYQLWFVFHATPLLWVSLFILGIWIFLVKVCLTIAQHPTLRGVKSLHWDCQAMSNLRFELGVIGLVHLTLCLVTFCVQAMGLSLSFWGETGFSALIAIQLGWVVAVLEKYLFIWTLFDSCEEASQGS